MVHWTAPEDDGGAEITNYVLQYRIEDTLSWVQANMEDLKELQYKTTGQL